MLIEDGLLFSPDGHSLFCNGTTLIDSATGEEKVHRRVVPHYNVRDFCLSAGGKQVFLFGGTYRHQMPAAPEAEGVVAVIPADLSEGVERLPSRDRREDSCGAVSPDGKWLVTARTSEPHGTKSVVVFDFAKRERVLSFDAQVGQDRNSKTPRLTPHDVSSVTFSPDGKLLAVAGGANKVELFDATDGFKPCGELPGHTWGSQRVVFDKDGKRVASVSWDGTARIWDVKEKTDLHRLDLKNTKHTEPVDVAFSPDGKLVATVDGTDAKLWDAATGKEVRTIATQLKVPSRVAFSPDGKHVAIGFADRSDPKNLKGGVEQFVVETGKPRELKAKK